MIFRSETHTAITPIPSRPQDTSWPGLALWACGLYSHKEPQAYDSPALGVMLYSPGFEILNTF